MQPRQVHAVQHPHVHGMNRAVVRHDAPQPVLLRRVRVRVAGAGHPAHHLVRRRECVDLVAHADAARLAKRLGEDLVVEAVPRDILFATGEDDLLALGVYPEIGILKRDELADKNAERIGSCR